MIQLCSAHQNHQGVEDLPPASCCLCFQHLSFSESQFFPCSSAGKKGETEEVTLATASLIDRFSRNTVKSMTAQQIIEEIKRLDPKEQLGVIRFAYQLDAERQLSGPELSKLATRMTETDDAVEAVRIRETIVRGFYGTKPSNA
jgi:hypothetical protein